MKGLETSPTGSFADWAPKLHSAARYPWRPPVDALCANQQNNKWRKLCPDCLLTSLCEPLDTLQTWERLIFSANNDGSQLAIAMLDIEDWKGNKRHQLDNLWCCHTLEMFKTYDMLRCLITEDTLGVQANTYSCHRLENNMWVLCISEQRVLRSTYRHHHLS